MNVQVHMIDRARQTCPVMIPDSPAGPILVLTYGEASPKPPDVNYWIPKGGCAIVLPLSTTTVAWPGVEAMLIQGCYAQVPGQTEVIGGHGLIIHTPAYQGLPQLGGPVEDMGRLKYIDGCSDSLLVCPARLGEPCLNLLHLPAGVDQTMHTHPSERIGIILRGSGVCRTPDGTFRLEPGMFWHIPTESAHSFHTGADSLDVLAWHPDSDFGPTHDAHPMLNRTIVEGTPASAPVHANIRTESIRA